MDGMKQIMVEGMEKAESIGYRKGLAAAANLALYRFTVSSKAAGMEVHQVFDDIMDLMRKATPEEIHTQRVEGASGGDPDPS